MTQNDPDPSPQPDVPSDAQPDTQIDAQPAGEAPPTGPAPVQPPPAPPAPPPAAPILKTRWRDRVFTFRAILAVALAGLVLGVGAGAGTALVAGHDDGPDVRHQRMGPDEGGFPGWGGRTGPDGQPPGMGQLPPGTVPQQQGDTTPDDTSDDPSDDTSGS